MKHTLKIALSTSLVAVLFTGPTYAQTTTASVNATVTVTSVINITATDLDFGTLVVVQDGTNAPSATLNPDGSFDVTTPTGTENLIQLGTAAPSTVGLDVGAAVSANLQVTFPASTTLAHQTTAATFTVDALQIGALTTGTFGGSTASQAACNTAISGGNPCQFQTAADGSLGFPLGATITVGDVAANYDGVYAGTFDLVAQYY